jgi:hypothetical protein
MSIKWSFMYISESTAALLKSEMVSLLVLQLGLTLCKLEMLYLHTSTIMRALTVFFVCLMVFNATFNIISIILWWSVLLVEVTGGPGKNHRSVTSHWQILSHNVLYLALIEIQMAIGTDCIGSCKSNYHTITAMTAPLTVFVNML